MKRGDIYAAATGSGFGSKPRPVLVLQSEDFGDTPNVIVALFNSAVEPGSARRPQIEPDRQNGLDHVSELATDILVTVPRRKFGQRIGRISAADQRRVDTALLVFLGFA